MTATVAIYLISVLVLLGLAQWIFTRVQDTRALSDFREAENQGLNHALTQHPHINLSRCIGCGCCVRACPEKKVLTLHRGKSTLLLAAHCVGHGLCEQSCPTGAISVGLGDVSGRTDIPLLSDDLETSVSGVFIAGELGGIGLIRHAINQGVRVSTTVARRMRRLGVAMGSENPVDLLVVGCGPSGIAAALKGRELGLSVTVVDGAKLGGAVSRYPKNKLTLTHPVTLPIYGRMRRSQYTREELIAIWKEAFNKANIQVRSGTLFREVSPEAEGCLRVETSTGTIQCRSLVLALGRRGTPRRLNVPGERADHVHYRLDDAQHYQHQAVLVVGGGDSAVEAALSLADQAGNRVTLSYRRKGFFRIKPFNQERLKRYRAEGRLDVLFQSQVKEILPDQVHLTLSHEGDDSVQEERILEVKQVFVLAGGLPPYEMLKKIGVRFGGGSSTDSASTQEAIHAGQA